MRLSELALTPNQIGALEKLQGLSKRTIGLKDPNYIINPIKYVSHDTMAAKFDSSADSAYVIQMASEKFFDPNELVSSQKWISVDKVRAMIVNRKRNNSPIIIKTSQGLYIFQGTYRAVAALLLGEKLRAKFIDLEGVNYGINIPM